MHDPLTLWILGDGKPGHENQSLGLAAAIARRAPCSVHRVAVNGARWLPARLRAAVAASAGLPSPDLVIGAGHACHAPLLWLARKHRARSVVLMRPSLPVACFDLCIAPRHDFPASAEGPRLLLTRGALNRIEPHPGERRGGLILLGGPSRIHGWDPRAMLAMLARITSEGTWELTDSRRTPEAFLAELRRSLPQVAIASHHDTPADWLPYKLQHAAEVWVSEDSVSMVYEALSSGARVGLLPVPRLAAESRVLRGLDGLVADGFVTPYPEWCDRGRIAPAPEILREADRCAGLVLRRFGLQGEGGAGAGLPEM